MIKYDEYELIEFFGNIPEKIDDKDGLKYSFFKPQSDFSLIINVYDKSDSVIITLKWKQKILFHGFYTGINEIVKNQEKTLTIKQKNSKMIILKDKVDYYSIITGIEENAYDLYFRY